MCITFILALTATLNVFGQNREECPDYMYGCYIEKYYDESECIGVYGSRMSDNIVNETLKYPRCLEIKAISLHETDLFNLDHFRVCENVEVIEIENPEYYDSLLEVFPKLERVYINAVVGISLPDSIPWLDKVVSIHGSKSTIYGLTTFKNTPNIETIRVNYGDGFDPFPADINSLAKLKYVDLGPFITYDLDLSQIDLTNFPELQEFNVLSYNGDHIKGIPKGIDLSRGYKLSIKHPNLTAEEKRALTTKR